MSSRRPLLSISSNAHALHTQKHSPANPVAAAAHRSRRNAPRRGSGASTQGDPTQENSFAPNIVPDPEKAKKEKPQEILKNSKVSSNPD